MSQLGNKKIKNYHIMSRYLKIRIKLKVVKKKKIIFNLT